MLYRVPQRLPSVPLQTEAHLDISSGNFRADLRSDLGAIGAAAAGGVKEVRSDIRDVGNIVASIREEVQQHHDESMQFFNNFTMGVEATLRTAEATLRSIETVQVRLKSALLPSTS